MDGIVHKLARRMGSRILVCGMVAAAMLLADGRTRAQDTALPPMGQVDAATMVRSGGIIDESYSYHRQPPIALQPMRSAIEMGCIPQANGWYDYGFPMRSYRWGWFGAERHYPRVIWHQGYYGDCLRTAYRNGY